MTPNDQPQTDPNLVQPKETPEPTPAELHAKKKSAFGVVRSLLLSVPAYCTKAIPGGDLLELPEHDDFRPATNPGEASLFEANLAGESTVDGLLTLEEKLMVQLERLEGLERALQKSGGKRVELASYLESATEDIDALFDQTMREVKAKDRELEKAAWSFRVFMEESRLAAAPEKAKLVHVLNARGDDLASHPHFGKKHRFGPIKGLPRIQDDVYGLWVLDTKVLNSGQASTIGLKAYNHTAMAILNADAEKAIPSKFYRDCRGDAARHQELLDLGATRDRAASLQYAASPVTERELKWLDNCVGEIEGLERVVLCFSPLRVREATRYEQALGDVFVPSSYTYGGKVVFLSLVSRKYGISTPVAQLKKELGVSTGSYVESRIPERARKDNGPSLFDHNGSLEQIPAGVVAVVRMTGAESEKEMKGYVDAFIGLHTARGKDAQFQVATELSYDYLRRIMTVLARGIIGQPQNQALMIRDTVESLLQQNLMSRDAEDRRKPFNAISVTLDDSSPEGQQAWAKGGIRLIIKVKGRTAIPDVWINIVPERDKSATNASDQKGG
ncbi:MAG: hypothetical protein U1A77_18805 [Pirellulales bacterium]